MPETSQQHTQTAQRHITDAEQLVASAERRLAAAKAQLAAAQTQLQAAQTEVATAQERVTAAADQVRATQPLALRPAEAAQALSLSHSALYALLMRGELKSLKVGRVRLIPISELNAFIGRRLEE
jgi:excisionase family DNA binding protein